MREKVLRELAEFAAGVDIGSAPRAVADALQKTLVDSIGVGIAGMETPELLQLRRVWHSAPGDCSLWGAGGSAALEAAIMLNGTALCALELDEGNKFARGHPGAHVLPAALAEAQRLGRSGREFTSAVLAGYEVAARIARAFVPRAGLHPHGHWGAVGAATAVGRLNGFSAEQLAQAMDAAAGLALASPFSSALAGSFVRNAWVGAAGVNGVTAARLVEAGLGSVDGTGLSTYGDLLGAIDSDEVVRELGERWEASGGYIKRHASCNYTHPPADAAILVRERHSPPLAEIARVEVATHALAAPLDGAHPRSRLAAMFSIPHVVAVAIAEGACPPERFAPARLDDPEISRLRETVSVVLDDGIDARRPAERGARVTVVMADGSRHEAQVPNSVGDADYLPFSLEGVVDKLETLIGAERAERVRGGVASLAELTDMRDAARFLG